MFGIPYYSITTTIIFSMYLLSLLVIGTKKIELKRLLVISFVLLTLFIQWYSIRLTLESIAIMNENPGYFEYGSDLLVIVSWLMLLTGFVKLNLDVIKRFKGNY
jgi:hypothetical protein